MSTLEAALRGGAAALLAFLAVAALHGRRRSKAQPFSALLAASAGAYAVVSAPDLVHQHAVWLAPLRLLSIGTPAVFWLWAAACFDDEFQPSWEKFLPWVVLVSLGAFCILGGWFVFWPAVKALALLFASLAVWQALSGRASDLVETRRHFRVILAIGAGLFIAAITITEVVPVGSTGGIPDTTLNAAGLVVVAFAFALMRLFEERDTALVPQPSPSPLLSDRPAKPIPADPQEPALLAALRGLMEDDKVYREEGLSITMLAARLGTPEYRLRRLINRRLAHRNFNSFVNGYRLAEARAALADPTQAEVPILTIALDAGFQSIGPFNRAFKAQTGMTPSEFRRRRLAASYAAAAK
jgi:AraC-like DNA-binding protein